MKKIKATISVLSIPFISTVLGAILIAAIVMILSGLGIIKIDITN